LRGELGQSGEFFEVGHVVHCESPVRVFWAAGGTGRTVLRWARGFGSPEDGWGDGEGDQWA
jgi:hypothetical protein